MSKPARQQNTVSALKRGIAVLNCFRPRFALPQQRGDRGTDAGAEADRDPASRDPGVARPDAAGPGDGEIFARAGVLSLAQSFLSGLDVRAYARRTCTGLPRRFGGSVFLAIRDGLEMVLIETCRARSSVLTVRLEVGPGFRSRPRRWAAPISAPWMRRIAPS